MANLNLTCLLGKLDNCVVTFDGQVSETYTYEIPMGGTTKCVITANDGWEFDTVPDNSGYYGVWGFYISGAGGYIAVQFEISEDKKTATYNFPYIFDRYFTKFQLTNCSAILNQVAVDVVGVNNVYLVDTDILHTLSNERFINSSIGGEGTSDYIIYDYGNYIINLLLIPYELPEVVGESEPIILGDKQLTVSAPALLTDVLKYDLGTIEIPKPENSLGVHNVECVLYLPALNPIVLSWSDVLGHTIDISLEIDAYTGTATYTIASSLTGETIDMRVFNLGVDVPLANSYSLPEIKLSGSLAIGGDNKILTPFIRVLDYNSDLNNGFFNSKIMADGNLSEETGYIEVLNIDIQANTMFNELEVLNSILKSGVIIK